VRRRSMGTQHALGRAPPRTWEALDAVLVALVDRLARRLRAARRVCRTIVLRLRFDDFTRATRSHTIAEATARTPTILTVARGLLSAAMPTIEKQGITLLGIALSNLDDDSAIQLAFPFDQVRATALDEVLDAIRERFGSDAITRAVLIGRKRHITVPLLPD
jgi:DNA polymerase-4